MSNHFKASPNGANERVWPVGSNEADTLTHAFYNTVRPAGAGPHDFTGEYSEHAMTERAAHDALAGNAYGTTGNTLPYHYPAVPSRGNPPHRREEATPPVWEQASDYNGDDGDTPNDPYRGHL